MLGYNSNVSYGYGKLVIYIHGIHLNGEHIVYLPSSMDNGDIRLIPITKIDCICGQMPKAEQKDVEFCCEAAFTGELLEEFNHSNIADNHICNGEMKKGYRIFGTVGWLSENTG